MHKIFWGLALLFLIGCAPIMLQTVDYDDFRNQALAKGFKFTAESYSEITRMSKAGMGAGNTQSRANQIALEACAKVASNCIITIENNDVVKTTWWQQIDNENKNADDANNIKVEKEKITETQKSTKKKETLDKKFILKKDEDTKITSSNKNKNLVVFYIEKEVPNKNWLPRFSSDNQKIISLNSLDKNQLKKILAENDNILIITPKSISLNKRNTEEKYLSSKYVSGTDRVVNDANQNLQRELQAINSEISRLDAGRARAREAAASYGYCAGNIGCLTQQIAATAAAEQWVSQLDDAVNQRNNIIRQLNSTPTYLDRKSYKNYSYKLTTIKNSKDVAYNLVEINNEKFFKNSIYLIDAAEFSIVSNVNSADESYREIVSGSKSLQDVDNWEKSRFRNVQLKELNNDANKIEIKSSETLESLELQKNIFKVLFSK